MFKSDYEIFFEIVFDCVSKIGLSTGRNKIMFGYVSENIY